MAGNKALSALRQAASYLIDVLEVNSDKDPLRRTTKLIIGIARAAKKAGVTPPVSHRRKDGEACIVVSTPTGGETHDWAIGPFPQSRFQPQYRHKVRESMLYYLRFWGPIRTVEHLHESLKMGNKCPDVDADQIPAYRELSMLCRREFGTNGLTREASSKLVGRVALANHLEPEVLWCLTISEFVAKACKSRPKPKGRGAQSACPSIRSD